MISTAVGSCPSGSPAPTPRLVMGGHSRLTLMFVLRLEVVCPVVCRERRRYVAHRSPPGLPCAQGSLTQTAGSTWSFCSCGATVVITVASRGGSFSEITYEVGSGQGSLCKARAPGSGEVSQGTGPYPAQTQDILVTYCHHPTSCLASLLLIFPASPSLYQLLDCCA